MQSPSSRVGRARLAAVVLVVGIMASAAGLANAALIDNFDPPNAFVTATQANTAPGPLVWAGGPAGQYLRLINDTINNQSNHYSYNTTDFVAPGWQYSLITATFNFAGFSADQAADGFSFSLIPTSVYGYSGMGPALSEAANATGTFGLGFRTYPAGTNHLAVHWNNAEIARVAVDPAVVSFSGGTWNQAQLEIRPAGPGSYVKVQLVGNVYGTPQNVTVFDRYVFGLTGYEDRAQFSGRTGGADMNVDLDNVNVQYGAAVLAPGTAGAYTGTFQDFDNLGTTPFTLTQAGSAPVAQILPGGPTGNFLRLVQQTGSQVNQIAFDRTNLGLYGRVEAEWDFSVLTGADGGAFLLANTGWHGITGAVPNPTWEEPNVANAFAIGFDVYPNMYGVSLHWNGQQIVESNAYDYRNLWRHAHAVIDFVAGGANVSLDVGGTPIFTNQFIAGMTPYESRAAFGARTGGVNTNFDLDNIRVQWSNPVAQPTDPFHWRGITGDYATAGNWTNNVLPTGNDNAVIDVGVATGTVNLQGTGSLTVTGTGGLNVGSLQVAGAAGARGNLILGQNAVVYSGGDFYVANGAGSIGDVTIGGSASLTVNGTHTVIGRGGVGHVVQNGGAVSLRRLFISEFGGSAGSTWDLNAGTLTASDVVNVGRSQQGTFTQNGGTFTTSSDLYVANGQEGGAGATGTYNMNAGTLTVNGTHTVVGRNGVGQFVQNGGTVNLKRLFVAEFNGPSPSSSAGSIYTMNGGVLNLSQRMEVGRSAAATFTQTGGVVNALSVEAAPDNFSILVGRDANAGVYNLQGGTLNVNTLRRGPAGAFNFTGGALHARTIDFTGSTFTNNGGRLAPGASPGLTDILGNYVQTAAGVYEVELGGYTPVSGYDQVHVTGTATLDGLVDILLISPFVPALGTTFDVLIADQGINDLGLELRYTSPWFRYDIIAGAGNSEILRLTAVPEPSTWALLAIGLGGLAAAAWRRRK